MRRVVARFVVVVSPETKGCVLGSRQESGSKGEKRRQLIVKTKNLRIAIATVAACSGALLEAKLHTHLLPRVLGAKLRTVHGKMRLAGRRCGGRRHWLLSGGARAGVIGQRQVS